ncbi:hypothetical protein QJS10_CPB17g00704 [Acorus calamus]|uniref:Uncharacterized protein n=1 Tax=Acorus calamus TaxID=4465 RepID=A0AAV9CWE7_ACOCL|nr:hypothetical protein QJS10_CPB17g00704 [Acorus calamus]
MPEEGRINGGDYRSTGLCRPSETHFDWASVDTYSDSSTDLYCPSEEHFDWTLSNWVLLIREERPHFTGIDKGRIQRTTGDRGWK